MFFNATNNGISPLAGFQQLLEGTGVQVNYAEGAKLWSNDQSEIAAAVSAAQNSDVAVVVVRRDLYTCVMADSCRLGRGVWIRRVEESFDSTDADWL